MRLFLDANVIFSAAHNPTGNAMALFRLAEQDVVVLTSSRFAVEEAQRNIALKYPERAERFESLRSSLELLPEPSPSLVTLARKAGLVEKDAPILGAAIGARVDALVTGDRRHFGPFFGRLVEGVRVVLPAQAVAIVLDGIREQ
jgi:predicted nucleic acid-binding protein